MSLDNSTISDDEQADPSVAPSNDPGAEPNIEPAGTADVTQSEPEAPAPVEPEAPAPVEPEAPAPVEPVAPAPPSPTEQPAPEQPIEQPVPIASPHAAPVLIKTELGDDRVDLRIEIDGKSELPSSVGLPATFDVYFCETESGIVAQNLPTVLASKISDALDHL